MPTVSSIRYRASRPLLWLSLLCIVVALAVAGLPDGISQAQQPQFANPAFKTTYDRSDGPVASTVVKRPWVWGPAPGRTLSEPFVGIPGNAHIVQYFDKGRMEINNPNGNPNDPFYVTNGLLTVELVSGFVQTGVSQFERRSPAAIPLASDADDASAPTYQSFNGVSNVPGAPNDRRAASQVGQIIRTAIDRAGATQPWPQDHPDYGVRVAHYETATGHNVPDVFWTYLNQQTDIIQGGQLVKGPLFFPWFAVSGYPISEAYWSYVKVGGRYTDVLIQAFERRVLTYVPGLPSPFKVQMGNIGQHYYDWRYLGQSQATQTVRVSSPTAAALPPRANVTIDSITYRSVLTDINGTFATLTNRGATVLRLNGWYLDSPKWNFVDRFAFPNGVQMAPGASIRVHSGPGSNTATDIYMFRTTVMWDRQLYDLAVLYDNFGREVDSFFPASDVGQPTAPPAATATRPPGTAGTAVATATRPAATVGATGTPRTPSPTTTGGVPSPVQTGVAGTGTATATKAAGSTTPTIVSSGSPTATTTRTVTPTPGGSGGCPPAGEIPAARKARQEGFGDIYIYEVEFTGYEDEVVDVYNDGDTDVDVSGWVLRDKNETFQSYTFPQGTILEAVDSFFVYTEPGHTHTFNRATEIWSDCGDALELRDAAGVLKATYGYGNHELP